MSVKVVVHSVADVATLQTQRPDLKILTPTIPAGHPNEARYVEALNAAQTAGTIAQQNEALARANLLGSTTNWKV